MIVEFNQLFLNSGAKIYLHISKDHNIIILFILTNNKIYFISIVYTKDK